MIKLFRIEGKSLTPIFKGGELALGIKPNFLLHVKENDIVTFQYKSVGTMIKRVKYIKNSKVFVEGTIFQSVDSRTFGEIPLASIEYKILFKIPFIKFSSMK